MAVTTKLSKTNSSCKDKKSLTIFAFFFAKTLILICLCFGSNYFLCMNKTDYSVQCFPRFPPQEVHWTYIMEPCPFESILLMENKNKNTINPVIIIFCQRDRIL